LLQAVGELSLRTYVGGVVALAVALAASWAYHFGFESGPGHALGAAAFGAALLCGEALPARVGERSQVTAIDVCLVGAVAVLGAPWAALAALPCAFLTAGKDPSRLCYEAGRRVGEIFLAGAVFALASPPLLSSPGPASIAASAYGAAAAAATLVAANEAFDAGLLRVKRGRPFGETWEELVAPYLPSYAVVVVASGLAVAALLAYGPLAAVVLAAGSVGSQALVVRSRDRSWRVRELEKENLSLKRALSDAGAAFGALVVEALGRKDGRSDRRVAATSVYAHDLAREMGLGEERARLLRTAGLVHDVGMAYLPEELLLQADRPNSVAKKELAEHPMLGEAALARVAGFGEIARWVRWHHERPDGRGYPDRLRGPWIPPEARILAVAQAYASEVLDGPRRPGSSAERARARLVGGSGAEFDEAAVKALLRVLDTETEGYRMADDHRFVLPGVSPDPRAARPEGPGSLGEGLPGAASSGPASGLP
jgi:hypothetical protein